MLSSRGSSGARVTCGGPKDRPEAAAPLTVTGVSPAVRAAHRPGLSRGRAGGSWLGSVGWGAPRTAGETPVTVKCAAASGTSLGPPHVTRAPLGPRLAISMRQNYKHTYILYKHPMCHAMPRLETQTFRTVTLKIVTRARSLEHSAAVCCFGLLAVRACQRTARVFFRKLRAGPDTELVTPKRLL